MKSLSILFGTSAPKKEWQRPSGENRTPPTLPTFQDLPSTAVSVKITPHSKEEEVNFTGGTTKTLFLRKVKADTSWGVSMIYLLSLHARSPRSLMERLPTLPNAKLSTQWSLPRRDSACFEVINFALKTSSRASLNSSCLECHFLAPISAIKRVILASFWCPFLGSHFGASKLVQLWTNVAKVRLHGNHSCLQTCSKKFVCSHGRARFISEHHPSTTWPSLWG